MTTEPIPTDFERLAAASKAFRDLAPQSRARLAAGLRLCRYPRGGRVLSAGDAVSGAYIVVQGRLRVHSLSPQGDEATLYLVSPGESCVLALNCLFGHLPYPAWVEAAPGTLFALVPGEVYRTLFEDEPGVRAFTVSTLAAAVFRLLGELARVHARTLEERLEALLLEHASPGGRVYMTQQVMASHLGTRREVVARHLARWAAKGEIETGRGVVVLTRLFGAACGPS